MNPTTHKILTLILWDYNISPEQVLNVIEGRQTTCGHWDFEAIFIRMLERLSWYDLLHVLGSERIKENLTTEIILRIHNLGQRKRYERIRKILSGKAVSFTSWGAQFSEEIKDTLFSNRWYNA